jgi:hypothetical protein
MRLCALLSAMCILSSPGLALTPSFNPIDVVRQVRNASSKPSAGGREPLPDSGEFLVDTNVTLVPALGDQAAPALAFDGADFLVVWQDGRNGLDIYGARVTPQGTVLEPAGFIISHATGNQYTPAVAFDGTNFLVVWEDDRSGSGHVYGARVTLQGTVLDSSGLIISQAADDQYAPALAFDGANFLVVWEDPRTGGISNIYGARVTTQGTVLDSAGFVISQASSDQYSPAVSYGGMSFLVVWEDHRGSSADIYGARVTPQGTILDSAGLVISQATNDQNSPVVGFDGADFLVVWQDYRKGTDYDIFGARVTPEGTVLDSDGIAISQAAGDQGSPALAFDAANFLVAWGDCRNDSLGDIYGARVTPQGTVLDPLGLVISRAAGGRGAPCMGYDGTSFLAAWPDGRTGSGDIYGARVTQQGSVLDSAGVAISQGASIQYSPSVGFDGMNFLVVFEDRLSGNGDIYGARVTSAGVVLDTAAFVVCQAPGDQYTPVPAFDGANFLVVWGDLRHGSGNMDVYGARVTPQGVVLDRDGFVISQAADGQCNPAIAFDGTNFLVVWNDFRIDMFSDIYGARVTPQGTVLDPAGIPISTATSTQALPSIAFDGTDFLVVWEDSRSGPDIDLYGARVTPQGTVLDPSGIPVSRAAGYQEFTAMDFDGSNFIVVWRDHRSGSQWDIYGTRVTPQGTVLDTEGIPIWLAANYQYYLHPPAVAFDGVNSLVVWENNSSGSDWDIYGAHVTPGGMVFDSGPVVSQQGDQKELGLCRGNGSQMFLVYQGWASTVGSKGYNNYRIWGKMNPSPAVAEMSMPEVRETDSGATIVHGVLFLPAKVDGRKPNSILLDISGRRVLDLHPGANDVRALAPGVYFVREAQAQAQAVRKIVLTK